MLTGITPAKRRSSVAGFAAALAVTAVCQAASAAAADDFALRCSALSQQVTIAVIFEDRPVVRDDSRNVEALNGLFGRRGSTQHNVYGLTHAEPNFTTRVAARVVADGPGRICAMPDISLTLGFSELVVYLARELTDQCRRNVIREHEEEHVATWRGQLRASAQLLTTVLRREIGAPRVYTSRDEAETGLRTWVEELVTPWQQRILGTVAEAQNAIDTPVSYAGVSGRLRNCPPPSP